MSTLTEMILDATWEHGRLVAPPTSDELDRLVTTLKQRRSGTLYLMTAGNRFFMAGVASRVWIAHIYTEAYDSLWLSNPPRNGRSHVTFDCGRTPTKIGGNLTCRPSDAIRACREFFLAPAALPSGNWISEYSGPPISHLG